MENKAIEYIGEYKLRKKDYSHLHSDLQAGLVLTAYAITEINSLMRLFLNAAHPNTGNDILDSASWSQRHLLLRTISSKVFEYCVMLGSKQSRNADTSWSDEAKSIEYEISRTESMPGFKLSEYLRHEAANHYSFRAAKKNLNFTADKADFSLYVHKKHGNSFFPAGEEVMFIGRISRHIDSKNNDDFHKAMESWQLWVREVLIIISNSYIRLVQKHIFQKKPHKFARKISLYVPFSMVQEPRKPTAPLFIRDSRPSKCL